MPSSNGEKPPENLRPYLFHGVELDWSNGDDNAMGDCPLCGREEKFGVKVPTGQFRCFKCGESGNVYSFLRWLWKASDEKTIKYKQLAKDRDIAYPDSLLRWGVCRSVLTDSWMVPGYNVEGKLCQLYQYMSVNRGMRLLPTPTLGHQLHGVDLYREDKPVIYLCEGPWDAIALWETLGHIRVDDEGDMVPTASIGKSLLQETSVLAVPGCNTFFKVWLPLFSGKIVYIMYDNDHPREHPKTGKTIEPAGYSATQRVVQILSEAESPPEEIHYLHWGENGFDPDLPSGTDVRDMLNG